mmetsp:Transcript_12012/g.44666  ORF Transcript_12012/g.44666 Transcript_12012/m.44666 type:complete len:369 (-) Transcript_12012:126-1232(-)
MLPLLNSFVRPPRASSAVRVSSSRRNPSARSKSPRVCRDALAAFVSSKPMEFNKSLVSVTEASHDPRGDPNTPLTLTTGPFSSSSSSSSRSSPTSRAPKLFRERNVPAPPGSSRTSRPTESRTRPSPPDAEAEPLTSRSRRREELSSTVSHIVCWKNSSTSSKNSEGRGELWSPLNTNSGLWSPAYFAHKRSECLLSMKSSSRPCAKSAGQNEVSAAHSTSKSSVSKFARDFMLARIHPTAKRVAARGTPTYDPSVHLSTSSTIKSFKLANGESSTTPAIDGSSFAASSAVTAPIEVPHRPILPTEFRERRCDTTLATSVFSREPKLTCVPSLNPLPPKSSANTSIPIGSNKRTASVASHRLPELPCR